MVAKEEFEEGFLTQGVLSKSHILGSYLQAKYSSEMVVQMDFLHKDYIRDNPNIICYYGDDFRIAIENFAAALQTIVIDQNGSVLPVSYGFSKQYNIGNNNEWDGEDRLFEKFIEVNWSNLYWLFEATYNTICINGEVDVVPWSEMIVKESYL